MQVNSANSAYLHADYYGNKNKTSAADFLCDEWRVRMCTVVYWLAQVLWDRRHHQWKKTGADSTNDEPKSTVVHTIYYVSFCYINWFGVCKFSFMNILRLAKDETCGAIYAWRILSVNIYILKAWQQTKLYILLTNDWLLCVLLLFQMISWLITPLNINMFFILQTNFTTELVQPHQ